MSSCLWRGIGGDQDPSRRGKRETIPNTTLSPWEWFCIQTGSDDSHFNVFITVKGQVIRVSTNHNIWRERTAQAELNLDPSAYSLWHLTAKPNWLSDSQEPGGRECNLAKCLLGVQLQVGDCIKTNILWMQSFHGDKFTAKGEVETQQSFVTKKGDKTVLLA